MREVGMETANLDTCGSYAKAARKSDFYFLPSAASVDSLCLYGSSLLLVTYLPTLSGFIRHAELLHLTLKDRFR